MVGGVSKASQAAWYRRNRARLLAKSHANYAANRDAILAQQATYRQRQNPAERTAYNRAYYVQNADTIRARASAWHANMTPEQREAKTRQSRESRRGNPVVLRQRSANQLALRIEVLIGYGGSCACCSTAFMPHLTLDHVNGNGAAARRVENQRKLFYRLRRMLREGQPNDPMFQVLCWNCNLAKHHYGFCDCQH